MYHDIQGNPDYGTLKVTLDPGEGFVAESGAMSWMTQGTQVRPRLQGGFLKSLARKVFARESLVVGEYSHPQGCEVAFSPALPGSLFHRELSGEDLVLTAGSFLACSPGVELSTTFGGLRALFSGEGAFLLHASGHGDLFVSSYGAIVEKEVDGSLVVDTGHVVAWEEGLDYSIAGLGGVKSTVFSGEGLTMRFRGSGRIWLQTRTLPGAAGWIIPFLRG